MQTTAPKDRFCDLVMKGGITSGVIYPRLIGQLARDYNFKSIGGTSAGAIAAVATAAAEYQRRRTGAMDGFDQLDHLPDDLGATDAKGRTRLLRLFQPQQSCARLFGILESVLNQESARDAVLQLLRALPRLYPWMTALAAVALVAIIGSYGFEPPVIVAAFAGAALVFAVGLTVSIYYDLTHNLVANDFGLCSGLTRSNSKEAALTDWLHTLIQGLAGRTEDDPPLCFHELWEAPNPPAVLADEPARDRRSIDLRMFTTSLQHGRPYILPHNGEIQRLYFTRADLQPVLPEKVLQWLFDSSPRYIRKYDSEPAADSPALRDQTEDIRELVPERFPVLLAARLSLSFPVLLRAVRLRVMNFDAKLEDRTFHSCLFSDGGLCANFPIHLFDAALPMWPTFGVQLEPFPAGVTAEADYRIYLPQHYAAGYGERWNLFDFAKDGPAKLFGFLSALFDSAQNWNDNSMARMPGVRDRVVRIRLKEDEGGLNLNMKQDLIARMAEQGVRAAHALRDRFTSAGAPGWNDQRRIRLGVLVGTLKAKLSHFDAALQAGANTPAYDQLLSRDLGTNVPGFTHPFGADDLAAIRAILQQLEELADTLVDEKNQYAFEIVPDAALHIRPEL